MVSNHYGYDLSKSSEMVSLEYSSLIVRYSVLDSFYFPANNCFSVTMSVMDSSWLMS